MTIVCLGDDAGYQCQGKTVALLYLCQMDGTEEEFDTFCKEQCCQAEPLEQGGTLSDLNKQCCAILATATRQHKLLHDDYTDPSSEGNKGKALRHHCQQSCRVKGAYVFQLVTCAGTKDGGAYLGTKAGKTDVEANNSIGDMGIVVGHSGPVN